MVRIDKWLWAARFFKTRNLAQDAVENGRVLVGGERVKVARSLQVGETVAISIGDTTRTIEVLGLSDVRGPAPVAQALYRESAESIARRLEQVERRRYAREPARSIQGRLSKQDRRAIARVRLEPSGASLAPAESADEFQGDESDVYGPDRG